MNIAATPRRRATLTAVTVALGCVLAVVATTLASRPARSDTPDADVVTLHADHATYQGLNNLVGASDAVATGTVLDVQPGADIVVPDDPAGSVPPIPQTDYTVRVDRSHKRGLGVGSTLVVVLTGGLSGGQQYSQEGVPQLTTGQQYVFFLATGDDGKFYPMAGGAAIAVKNADSSFALNDETTGAGTVSFTAAQLAKTPPADHVTFTVLRLPLIQVNGDVQGGNISVARSRGVPTGIAGTVLIAGRALAVDIAIDRSRASGSLVLDGTEFVITSGVGAFGKDGSVVVAAVAKSAGKAQAVFLQVFDR